MMAQAQPSHDDPESDGEERMAERPIHTDIAVGNTRLASSPLDDPPLSKRIRELAPRAHVKTHRSSLNPVTDMREQPTLPRDDEDGGVLISRSSLLFAPSNRASRSFAENWGPSKFNGTKEVGGKEQNESKNKEYEETPSPSVAVVHTESFDLVLGRPTNGRRFWQPVWGYNML